MERRVILDLSFPEGQTVNSGIPKKQYLGSPIDLRFSTVDDMSLLIMKKGRGSLIWKRDLKNCYRQFRIDQGDIRKFRYKVDDQIFVGLAILMGLSPRTYMCQRITSAVGYIISNMGFSIMVYIDVEVPELATAAYEATGQLFVTLGQEEKLPKASPPWPRRK